MNDDKRSTERFNLIDFQHVLDADTGEFLGYLGNISAIGIRLLRKTVLPLGDHNRLQLRYVCIGGTIESPQFNAKGMWNRDSETLPYHEVGFQIVDADDEALASIERVVADLKVRDSAS